MPIPEVKPLEGKTSIDQAMFFEPEMVSYQAAQDVADRIGEKIGTKVDSRSIVLADDEFLADLSNLQAVYVHLEGLTRDYSELGSNAQTLHEKRERPMEFSALSAASALTSFTPLAALTGGLSSALGLLSLFRQDTEYYGRKTNIDPKAFRLMLAGVLLEKGALIVELPQFLIAESGSPPNSLLRERLSAAHTARQLAWKTVRPLIVDLARVDAELDIAARAGNQAEVDRLSRELASLRRDLDPITSPLSQLDSRFNELETQWQRIDEKTGLAPLARLLRAESVTDFDPLYLYAGVVSAGGSYRVRKSLLRTLFVGDGLRFSGGVVAMFALLDRHGSILASGVERKLLPFRSFREVTE